MINLLNPEDLKQLKAARLNVKLRAYTTWTLLAVACVGIIYGVSFKIADDKYTVSTNEKMAAESTLVSFQPVKKQAEEYQANLAVAKKILGSEIVFSEFIIKLASIMPPNTVIENLTLSTKSMGTVNGKPATTDIRARAKSYNDVIALKTKLEQQTDLFSDVRITSTTNSESATTTGMKYPYTVILNVVIKKASSK